MLTLSVWVLVCWDTHPHLWGDCHLSLSCIYQRLILRDLNGPVLAPKCVVTKSETK